MKKLPLALILVLPILALTEPPVSAEDDSCELTCTSSSPCWTECMEDPKGEGPPITCGEWGVCDADPDGDGLVDIYDNCPASYNPGQEDCDGDGTGDVCDPENGDFYAVSIQPCFIRSRLHFGWYEQNRYWEGLYRDRSACNSPEEYRFVGDETGNCTAWSYDEFGCCMNLWNDGWQCNNILDNNTCHY